MKKAFYKVILILLLLYIFFELFSLSSLFLLRKIYHIKYSPISITSISKKHRKILQNSIERKTKYIIYSSALGWTIKPNGASFEYKANSQGIRSNREYEFVPLKNTIRIAAFGNSFTHCTDVRNDQTWQEFMNQTAGKLEVLNFGVPGYGLDQSLLRYQQIGVQYHPHIVLIGFMSENIFRNLNVYRPFYQIYTELPFSKPRFIIENNHLVLVKNPIIELERQKFILTKPKIVIPKLGIYDYYFPRYYKKGKLDFLPSVRLFKILRQKLIVGKYGILKNGVYNENSEAFKITIKIFEKFVNLASRNNSLSIIIVFPDKEDLTRYRENKFLKYRPLLDFFEEKDYKYIDTLDAFVANGKDFGINDLFYNFHYTSLANKLVAKHIMHYLESRKILESIAKF